MAEFKVEEHVLVPKHEILSEKEAKEMLMAYNIQKEQLPKILVDDPCARILGAKPGQVLKITRRSIGTASVSVGYRVVVEKETE